MRNSNFKQQLQKILNKARNSSASFTLLSQSGYEEIFVLSNIIQKSDWNLLFMLERLRTNLKAKKHVLKMSLNSKQLLQKNPSVFLHLVHEVHTRNFLFLIFFFYTWIGVCNEICQKRDGKCAWFFDFWGSFAKSEWSCACFSNF